MRSITLTVLTVGTFFNSILLFYALVAFFWWPLLIQGPHEADIWQVPIALALAWASPFVILGSTVGSWYLYKYGRFQESMILMYLWMVVYIGIYAIFF